MEKNVRVSARVSYGSQLIVSFFVWPSPLARVFQRCSLLGTPRTLSRIREASKITDAAFRSVYEISRRGPYGRIKLRAWNFPFHMVHQATRLGRLSVDSRWLNTAKSNTDVSVYRWRKKLALTVLGSNVSANGIITNGLSVWSLRNNTIRQLFIAWNMLDYRSLSFFLTCCSMRENRNYNYCRLWATMI